MTRLLFKRFRLHFPGIGGGKEWRMRVAEPGSVVVAVWKWFVCCYREKNQDAASLQQRCGSRLRLLGLPEPQQVHRAGNMVSRSSGGLERLAFCL